MPDQSDQSDRSDRSDVPGEARADVDRHSRPAYNESMKCPVDNDTLAALEHDAVEVDYCFACGGVWLDAGELALLYDGDTPPVAFLEGGSPHCAEGEAARPCPICGKRMAKAVTAGERPVVYDRCVAGHGLWFDAGELAALIAQGGGAAEHAAAWLRGIFGGMAAAQGERK